MSTWLYQLSQKHWPPEVFRYEIREGHRWGWDYGKKVGDSSPALGDTVVFFYSPSNGKNPGIYGWAVIERCDEDRSMIYFIPTHPSDHLKMDPWWDDEAKEIVDAIRGKMPRPNLFQVPEELVARIRVGVKRWLRGPT